MAKINNIKWELEPHTEAKHVILRKYLSAWFPIMTRYSSKVVVVDGFAGPGEYNGGQEGSPIIAIKTLLEHKVDIKAEIKFVFIEKDKDRCAHLKDKLKSFKMPENVKYHIECSQFSMAIMSVLDELEAKDQPLAPSFFFMDPFGYKDIPMKLIKRIMGHKKCEVFINFMYEEINRFMSLDQQEGNYNELFGTDEWKKIRTVTDSKKRMRMVHSIYKEQLEKMANIKYVRYFKMVNKRNKLDYFLFFGTNNIKGLQHMKRAMWKVDGGGRFQFSDATHDPNQLVLFEPEPNYNLLQEMIMRKYKGSIVSAEDLERFVLVDTPFLETHYKTQILRPMEKSENIKVYRSGGKKGTYPSGKGLKIKFL